MKKKDIVELIKYHSENNVNGFRDVAYRIAQDFDSSGDTQLAQYIVGLLSNTNTFVPQLADMDSGYFRKVTFNSEPLPLPDTINKSINGVINAIGHKAGINKFLFQGAPGTGKTESAKQIARILGRELYIVDFDSVIDCKLGQTSKNIATLFDEINSLPFPEEIVILFDEIDSIALDRNNFNDLREMGRATSSVIKGFDSLNSSVVLLATTNLYENFDKAVIRRFDLVVNFNKYTDEDLKEVASVLCKYYANRFTSCECNVRLLKKIFSLIKPLPYPGTIKNLIRTSMAFSNPDDKFDYFRYLLNNVVSDYNLTEPNIKFLHDNDFTVREIEILTKVSKSQVSKLLKEN